MGSSGSVLGENRLNMNLQYFGLFLLLVLIVNGKPKADPKPSPKAAPKPIPKAAPKPIPNPNPNPNPKPIPKSDPKAKAQMALIFNKKSGGIGDGTGESGGEELAIDWPGLKIDSIGGGFNYIDSTGKIYKVDSRGNIMIGGLGTYPIDCNGWVRGSFCKNKKCYITCGDGRKTVIFCPSERVSMIHGMVECG